MKGSIVLIVEDNLHLAEMIGQTVKKLGYQPYIASSLDSALQVLKRINPILVIADVCLKDTQNGGGELSHVMRSHAEWAHIPIIMISGMGAPFLQTYSLQSGADAYLSKPIDFELLELHLWRLLRKMNHYTPYPPNIITSISCSLNLDNRVFTSSFNKNGVPLTEYESELLCYMMERPRQVIHLDELRMEIWGDDPRIMRDSNAVRQHIYNLRNKIDPSKSKRERYYIHTKHNRGYYFEDTALQY